MVGKELPLCHTKDTWISMNANNGVGFCLEM